jgi:hypothetical protein
MKQMEGLFAAWRSQRYHLLWVLHGQLGLPRDVARYLVLHYVAWESAYCWLCLREFRVHVWGGRRGVVVWEHDDKKPVCGMECVAIAEMEAGTYWSGGAENPSKQRDDAEYLRGYDFLERLGAEPHHAKKTRYQKWTVTLATRRQLDALQAMRREVKLKMELIWRK